MINYWSISTWIMCGIALIGSFLNAKMRKSGFIFWIISNLYMVIYFWRINEWAQFTLNACYLYLAIYGWYKWDEKK